MNIKTIFFLSIILILISFTFAEETKETEKKIRLGARANVGQSMVDPSGWEIPEIIVRDPPYGYIVTPKQELILEGGYSLGIGAFALIPFSSIYFVPEMSLQRRQPINKDASSLAETAIDIPLMFRFRYRDENLIYLGVGPLLGIVLTSYYEDNGEKIWNKWRKQLDYGIAFELGFRINDNFSIDFRGLGSFASIGFTEWFEEESDGEIKLEGTSTLFQGQIGVNYIF
jgi:hypothetical protein